MRLSPIPHGWRAERLGDVASIGAGDPAPQDPAYFASGQHLFVRMQDVGEVGRTPNLVATNDKVNDLAVRELGLHKWPGGTTLVPKSGASINLNNRVKLGTPAYVSSHLATVEPTEQATAEFLYHLLCQFDVRALVGNSGYPSLSLTDLRGAQILCPPLAEQRGIAAFLDAIDAAIERMQDVIASVEHLRSAILQQLLTRGIPGWHSEYKDVPGVGTIPADWEVVQLNDVAEEFRYGTSVPCHLEPIGTPVLRIPNVAQGQLDLADLKYGDVTPKERATLRLVRGDLLFVRTNGNPALCGQCCLVDGLDGDWLFASYLVRMRLDHLRAVPEFVGHYLRSSSGRRSLKGNIRTSAGNYNLSVGGLRKILTPLPSRAEQQAIVDAVAGFDRTKEAMESEAKRLGVLKRGLADVLLSGRVRVPMGAEVGG